MNRPVIVTAVVAMLVTSPASACAFLFNWFFEPEPPSVTLVDIDKPTKRIPRTHKKEVVQPKKKSAWDDYEKASKPKKAAPKPQEFNPGARGNESE